MFVSYACGIASRRVASRSYRGTNITREYYAPISSPRVTFIYVTSIIRRFNVKQTSREYFCCNVILHCVTDINISDVGFAKVIRALYAYVNIQHGFRSSMPDGSDGNSRERTPPRFSCARYDNDDPRHPRGDVHMQLIFIRRSACLPFVRARATGMHTPTHRPLLPVSWTTVSLFPRLSHPPRSIESCSRSP